MVNSSFLLQLAFNDLPFTFMRLLYLLLFTFCFSICLACRPAAAPVSISNKPASINQIPQMNLPTAPAKPLGEMNWKDFAGKTEKIGELKGKVVVLDFWATNCPPCLKEIPHLVALQNKFGADNIKIIGLHVGDDDDRKRVPEFADKLKINYTLAYPEDALTAFVFRERNDIPQTIVLDRNGNVAERFVGFGEDIQVDLDKIIEQTISQK
jgi:thiol-disulfide isomerase/thioredoxin